MTNSTRQEEPRTADVLLSALAELAGPAIVLDRDLRVVDHTAGAEQLVGTPVPSGVTAPKLLCGMGSERPLAEALAEGRAVTARVERVAPGGGTTLLRVRAKPLQREGQRSGWVLLLEGDESQRESDASVEAGGMLTRNAGMKRLLERAERAARSGAPVLIAGEVGSGKTLLGRLVHNRSKRAQGPFRVVNCALRPAERLESELFGKADAPGELRLAEGGTLLLDEVAQLPLELSSRLLDTLSDNGGSDVRLIATTSRSLRAEVERGRFDARLLYRLRVIPLFVPPLRERSGDIELIARHLVAEHNRGSARQISSIAPGALDVLKSFAWPGNVRELDNAVRYAFVMGDGPTLMESELPPDVRGEDRGRSLPASIPPESAQLPNEARRILRALERAGGNRERAAASLGMSRVTLWRKLKAFDLEGAVRARRRSS